MSCIVVEDLRNGKPRQQPKSHQWLFENLADLENCFGEFGTSLKVLSLQILLSSLGFLADPLHLMETFEDSEPSRCVPHDIKNQLFQHK
jgi:hypothetical protein